MLTVRATRLADLPALQDVERRAGAPFRDRGMDVVADDDPPTLDVLATFHGDGRAWVADEDGTVVGYVLVEVLDGAAHVEQVTVDPRHAGRRIGLRLLETVETWARGRGLPALTLTSFAHVPWNAPYYARSGFTVVPDEQQSDGLRRVRDAERARGLDAWPRVAMRRPVAGSAG